MTLPLSHLPSIYSYQPYGIHPTAVFWLVLTAILMYAGPASVGLFYLLAQERRGERAKIVPRRPGVAARERGAGKAA